MGWELREGLNSQPGLSRALREGSSAVPRCPLPSPQTMALSPEPLSLHIHPFSLAKQTGGETKTDTWTENSILGCRFLYINKANQNTSKDDFPCLLLPSVSP